ncbi:MAG: Vitamin B12-binding protein [Stenotrophomonas maltophilia]|nr:MAG: Vitamin B12-binding protein [Stenotrophomonas maltophilia]
MRGLAALLVLCLCTAAGAAQRVVSLAPSMTDSVLELEAGGWLVGVLDAGERPAEIAGLPSVGRYGQLDLERLLSLHPDLVLVWPGSVAPAQLAQLHALGIAVYSFEPHRLDDLAEQFDGLGQALGLAERGHARAQEVRQRVAALRQRYAGRAPLKVFYQVSDRPLFTLGGTQVVSDALAACGARNLFAELTLPAPQVSVEAVLVRAPDVVLAESSAQLALWRDMPQLPAMRLKQLWVVPDARLERPSLGMLDATEALCRQLSTARGGE